MFVKLLKTWKLLLMSAMDCWWPICTLTLWQRGLDTNRHTDTVTNGSKNNWNMNWQCNLHKLTCITIQNMAKLHLLLQLNIFILAFNFQSRSDSSALSDNILHEAGDNRKIRHLGIWYTTTCIFHKNEAIWWLSLSHV